MFFIYLVSINQGMKMDQSCDTCKGLKGYPLKNCPYCGKESIERHMKKDGLFFCELCGFVTKEVRVLSWRGKPYKVFIPVGKRLYTKPNHKFLQRKYEKSTKNGIDYKIKDEYLPYLNLIDQELHLTTWQKREVKNDILKANGVKLFCRNCKYKTIIMAMCIYLMRADKRDIKIKDYSIIKKSGLTDRRYTSIVEKYSMFKIKNSTLTVG